MRWNWQQVNWPHFVFDPDALLEFELRFLHKAGEHSGVMRHVQGAEETEFRIALMAEEAFKTSEIEGEVLNRESLQSSIRRQLGLQTDRRRASAAEQGIAEMMVSLYRHFEDPLSHELLFSWHAMVTQGRTDLMDMGRYRTHEDPMQIVSGPLARPVVHFEAPPSKRVMPEMERFVVWFNESAADARAFPALTRAGLAHLYFESIHPFEDVNGRLGRAISEKALAQALILVSGRPSLLALSHALERGKKHYYEALHRASLDLEVTEWLVYFASVVLEAQDRSLRLIDFTVQKAQFFYRFAGLLNERQEKAALRMFQAGPEGFLGGLSADNYSRITGASASTATRDLHHLVTLGAFRRTGERKGTRYFFEVDEGKTD